MQDFSLVERPPHSGQKNGTPKILPPPNLSGQNHLLHPHNYPKNPWLFGPNQFRDSAEHNLLTYRHTYICTYIHTYIHTCTYIHACTYIQHTYTCAYTHTYTHTYVHTHIILTHIHAYVHTHTYYIHTYTHKYYVHTNNISLLGYAVDIIFI